jgi:hypothetical protein
MVVSMMNTENDHNYKKITEEVQKLYQKQQETVDKIAKNDQLYYEKNKFNSKK